MKKLLLFIILANLIAAPSYALKVITNNDSNRIVPSRSSMYDKNYNADDSYQYDSQYDNSSMQQSKKSVEDIGWLINEVRDDVMGGRWLYPNPNKNLNNKQNNSDSQYKNGSNQYNTKDAGYIREAADYYSVDVKKDSNENRSVVKVQTIGNPTKGPLNESL